jgi:hypothetical protein
MLSKTELLGRVLNDLSDLSRILGEEELAKANEKKDKLYESVSIEPDGMIKYNYKPVGMIYETPVAVNRRHIYRHMLGGEPEDIPCPIIRFLKERYSDGLILCTDSNTMYISQHPQGDD